MPDQLPSGGLRVSNKMFNKRTYLDPIHQDIILDREKPGEGLIVDLIDTPEFQRLRRIRQLELSSYIFQGAENSRFTHSVGVMHIAHRLYNFLSEKTPELLDKKGLVLASALLHDIGHGPLSHLTEKILGYHHEEWSCRIIEGPTKVNEVLRSYDKDLPQNIVGVLRKTYTPSFITHIVSSQLDCDRFDYLLRDSYMTGTSYGLFALQRVLSSMEVDVENDRIIVVGEKGQAAVEDYLFARYSMYAQVYYHKKNLAVRALVRKVLKRAKDIITAGSERDLFCDEEIRKWLFGEALSTDEYLYLDDVELLYHFKRWARAKDGLLSDLASRLMNRQLFRISRLPESDTLRSNIEERVRKLAKSENFDPDYYVTYESTGFRPYDYYRPDSDNAQTNIMVKTESGEIEELSHLSVTVDSLVRGNFASHWLVYPAEIADMVERDLVAV
jgi:uncharacterized protein